MTHLTRRQFDVLRLIAEGHTEKAISRELGITRNSVHTHCSRMLKSMGATCRAHAVSLGWQRGILGAVCPQGQCVVVCDAPSESTPDLSRADDGASGVGELETAKALADVLGRKVIDLHRQLDSARAWAVSLEQELAAVQLPYADALVAATGKTTELQARNIALSSLLRGMARRVVKLRRTSRQVWALAIKPPQTWAGVPSFYEADEPVANVKAAFERGEKATTEREAS